MGVGSDAVRLRTAAGTVRARKHGSRWEVWLPLGRPRKQLTKLSRRRVEEFATIDRYDGPRFTG